MKKLGSFVRVGVFGCFAAGVVSLVIPSLQGCACTTAGCDTGATLSVAAAGLLPEGTTATACFNDTCVVGALPAPATVMASGGYPITFPSGSTTSGREWTVDVTSRDRIEIEWTFPPGTHVQTGDRYRVTLNDSAGAQIATNQAIAVAYDKIQPNGAECGPTCHRAVFR